MFEAYEEIKQRDALERLASLERETRALLDEIERVKTNLGNGGSINAYVRDVDRYNGEFQQSFVEYRTIKEVNEAVRQGQ